MTIVYTCKFCRQDRQFEFEEEPGTPELQIEKWKKALACNWCADYHATRLTCEQDTKAQAESLIVCRESLLPGSARLAELEAKARQNLTLITKRFAKAVCQYFRLPLTWEPDFVEQIIAKPENALKLLRWYARNVSKFQR